MKKHIPQMVVLKCDLPWDRIRKKKKQKKQIQAVGCLDVPES